MFDELKSFIVFIYIVVPVLILVLGILTWWDKKKEEKEDE